MDSKTGGIEAYPTGDTQTKELDPKVAAILKRRGMQYPNFPKYADGLWIWDCLNPTSHARVGEALEAYLDLIVQGAPSERIKKAGEYFDAWLGTYRKDVEVRFAAIKEAGFLRTRS